MPASALTLACDLGEEKAREWTEELNREYVGLIDTNRDGSADEADPPRCIPPSQTREPDPSTTPHADTSFRCHPCVTTSTRPRSKVEHSWRDGWCCAQGEFVAHFLQVLAPKSDDDFRLTMVDYRRSPLDLVWVG